MYVCRILNAADKDLEITGMNAFKLLPTVSAMVDWPSCISHLGARNTWKRSRDLG